ncbi:MAG: hypothetical protein ABIE68_04215 [bacterium]
MFGYTSIVNIAAVEIIKTLCDVYITNKKHTPDEHTMFISHAKELGINPDKGHLRVPADILEFNPVQFGTFLGLMLHSDHSESVFNDTDLLLAGFNHMKKAQVLTTISAIDIEVFRKLKS